MERIERALEIARLQRPAREPAATTTTAGATAAATAAAVESAPTVVTSPAALSRPARAVVSAALPTPHAVPSAPLPRYALPKETLRERCILLADDPGAGARAYRMLRAQLLQRVRASRMRVFGVVSAVSGEGKTVTAINLALALAAEPNQQVALLDFDLRHPSISSTLGIAPVTGLDSWLTAGAQPASAVMCELEDIPRLQIAPTLAPVGSSSECLAGARARALLEELRQEDGRVLLLDLPPALLSDDVLTVSPLVDGFIFVVTEGRTRREDVERVIELIGRQHIVGTVLNGSIDSEQRAY